MSKDPTATGAREVRGGASGVPDIIVGEATGGGCRAAGGACGSKDGSETVGGMDDASSGTTGARGGGADSGREVESGGAIAAGATVH